jgi:hypothetical protein
VRERLRLRARAADRRDEGVLERGEAGGRGVGARPHREHHRQARLLEPQAAEVVVRRRVLERRLERRVADQQRRVRLLAERHVPRLREQHLGQDDGRGRLGRDGDRLDTLERHARDELDRVDGALGADAQPRQDPQLRRVARVLDRRDRREVELAGEEAAVQLRRHARDLLGLRLEAVEDRRHVDVADAAEADHAHPRPPPRTPAAAARNGIDGRAPLEAHASLRATHLPPRCRRG